MDQVRLLDAGVKVRVTLKDPEGNVVPVATATVIKYHFLKPDGSILSVDGALDSDGTDGKVKYTSDADDFDQVGIWRYQVYVTLSGGVLHSTQGKLKVTDIIKK